MLYDSLKVNLPTVPIVSYQIARIPEQDYIV